MDAAGDLVLFADQDRSVWDRAAIEEGVALAAAALRHARRPYALQAAIAACHATAPEPEDVDWEAVASLYGELEGLDPSPAVVLNRAVAVAEVDGMAAGLALVDGLLATPAGESLARTSHQPHVARADFLRRLGRDADAAEAYARAASMAPPSPSAGSSMPCWRRADRRGDRVRRPEGLRHRPGRRRVRALLPLHGGGRPESKYRSRSPQLSSEVMPGRRGQWRRPPSGEIQPHREGLAVPADVPIPPGACTDAWTGSPAPR